MTLHLPTTVDAILSELTSGNPRGYAALSDLMEFDHPITVHADGRVTDGPRGLYAPSLFDDELDDSRWELMDGYSGQYSYGGPIMHDSEYIGGRMARDILATPGTYVAIVSAYDPELPDVPEDFPVVVLPGDDPAPGRATCGTCDRSWDDSLSTGTTPVPAGRCPFEYFHAKETYLEGWAVARLSE